MVSPRILLRVTVSAMALFLISCQTARVRSFSDIKVGMDKSTVIDLVGGPAKSAHHGLKDRWVYIFHTQENEIVREVQFEHGRVSYVGNKITPEISAEEQDRLNEEVNSKELVQEQNESLVRQKQTGTLKLQSPEEIEKSADDLDLRLRDSLYGTQTYEKSERAKAKARSAVAPEFIPVN